MSLCFSLLKVFWVFCDVFTASWVPSIISISDLPIANFTEADGMSRSVFCTQYALCLNVAA